MMHMVRLDIGFQKILITYSDNKIFSISPRLCNRQAAEEEIGIELSGLHSLTNHFLGLFISF